MSYLDDLLAATEARVAAAKAVVGEGALEQRVAGIGAPRGFTRAIASGDVSIIAEIKRATPRAGVLDLELEAGASAARYEAGGAAAISVLTEPDYFKGSIEDFRAARSASSLPVLRKDFVLDDYQVLESRAEGADAVLLIVRAVGDRLDALHASVVALGMDALVEVNGEDELDRALDAGATLIGVNHRDLETFEVDPELTAKLAPRLPEGVTLVALSGVSSRNEVVALSSAGADAILIGKSIVTAADPAAKIRELLGRS
jgi:indole-3-glycerol phosphate synthase